MRRRVARAAATGVCGVAATGVWRQPRAGGVRDRGREERERDWRRERERSRSEKIKNMEGLFANSCQPDTTWHATSALEAGVARLGLRMEHLTKFRDPGGRFESLGT